MLGKQCAGDISDKIQQQYPAIASAKPAGIF